MTLRFRGTKPAGGDKPVTSSEDADELDYGATKPLVRKNESPELKASFWSLLTFQWFNEFINLKLENIDIDSLWDLKHQDLAETQSRAFDAHIANEFPRKATQQKTNGRPGSIRRALINTFCRSYLLTLVIKLLYALSEFVSPLALRGILRSLNTDEPITIAAACCVCLLLGYVVDSLLAAAYDHRTYSLGMRVRTAISAAIYKKSLVLSNAARSTKTAGEMVNLMTGDARMLMEVPHTLNSVCLSPIQIVLSLILIYRDLGVAAFAGFAGLLLLFPVGRKLRIAQKASQRSLMKFKDQRFKILSELLQGIRVIKLYAWELGFKKLIDDHRAKEMQKRRVNNIYNGIMQLMWSVAPYMMSVLTFGTYVLLNPNERLTSEKAAKTLCKYRTTLQNRETRSMPSMQRLIHLFRVAFYSCIWHTGGEIVMRLHT